MSESRCRKALVVNSTRVTSNLYLIRKCIGAQVDVHSYGGFNMSGTDSKAGGRDYLPLFLQGKSVSEKI